jgi:hypothetical protein
MYIVDTMLLAMASLYLLRGLGLKKWAAFLPALGMAFTGYAFTLITAGHRGVFDMMPAAVAVFGFLVRAINRQSLLHFAAAGLCAGMAINSQPDVALLFLMLASVYGLFRFGRFLVSEKPNFKRVTLISSSGMFLGILFFFAVSLASFGWLFSSKLVLRETRRGNTPEEKWEFATNWSLPPEDMIEFVAPCIFGVETSDRQLPYWGRLGRSLRWEPGKPGLRNLRQHTVYLGLIQLVFACYGLTLVLRRSLVSKSTEQSRDGPQDNISKSVRADLIFWLLAFSIAVMLALGRYFPLYKVFFLLPGARMIRCPVKFIHLASLCLCVLFGYGLMTFLHDLKIASQSGRHRRMFLLFAGLCLLLAGIAFAGSAIVTRMEPSLAAYWQGIGFGTASPALLSGMTTALRHAGFLFFACAAVFAYARRPLVPGVPVHALVMPVLVLALCIDITSVSRRYVKVRDVSAYYARNPIAESIQSGDPLARTSYRLSRRTKFIWLWGSFPHYGVDVVDPPELESGLPADYQNYYAALGKNALRLWQLTGTRFVVGFTDKKRDPLTAALSSHPAFDVVSTFSIKGEKVVQEAGKLGPIALLRFKSPLPRALVYHSWQNMSEEDALKTLASQSWDPAKSVLVTGEVPESQKVQRTTPVEIKTYGRSRIDMAVNSTEAGVLLLNDRYYDGWRVHVDGKEAPVLKCNYIMRGVHLPAGEHKVVFTYRPYLYHMLLSMAAVVALIVWAGVHVVTRVRLTEAGTGV